MEYIEILKNQHVDILGLINKLSSNLTGQKTAQSPVEIHNLLSKLSEKLKLHIDMENEILYPDLLDHPDRTIKEQVKKYIKDMDSLSEAYNDYLNNWTNEMLIQEKSEEFIYKTEQIIGLLLDRIYNEENILFPLLEKSK